jgi:hypothetical protein
MSRFFLEPGNPYDLSRDELEDLAKLVRAESSDLEVTVYVGDEHGYGVTFAEVLRLYTEAGELAGDTAALLTPFWIAVQWMRRRWQRDKDTHSNELPRTRYVTLYGPDGMKLKSIKIDVPDGEPHEEHGPESLHRRAWPPDRPDSALHLPDKERST